MSSLQQHIIYSTFLVDLFFANLILTLLKYKKKKNDGNVCGWYRHHIVHNNITYRIVTFICYIPTVSVIIAHAVVVWALESLFPRVPRCRRPTYPCGRLPLLSVFYRRDGLQPCTDMKLSICWSGSRRNPPLFHTRRIIMIRGYLYHKFVCIMRPSVDVYYVHDSSDTS